MVFGVKARAPKTPIVIARKESVVIQFASGSELFWGVEPNVEEVENVAKELRARVRSSMFSGMSIVSFAI